MLDYGHGDRRRLLHTQCLLFLRFLVVKPCGLALKRLDHLSIRLWLGDERSGSTLLTSVNAHDNSYHNEGNQE